MIKRHPVYPYNICYNGVIMENGFAEADFNFWNGFGEIDGENQWSADFWMNWIDSAYKIWFLLVSGPCISNFSLRNKSFAANLCQIFDKISPSPRFASLCAQVNTICRDLMVDQVNIFSLLAFVLTISLIGNRQVHKRLDPNFGHNGSSTDVFFWKLSSMSAPPLNPMFYCIRDCSQ